MKNKKTICKNCEISEDLRIYCKKCLKRSLNLTDKKSILLQNIIGNVIAKYYTGEETFFIDSKASDICKDIDSPKITESIIIDLWNANDELQNIVKNIYERKMSTIDALNIDRKLSHYQNSSSSNKASTSKNYHGEYLKNSETSLQLSLIEVTNVIDIILKHCGSFKQVSFDDEQKILTDEILELLNLPNSPKFIKQFKNFWNNNRNNIQQLVKMAFKNKKLFIPIVDVEVDSNDRIVRIDMRTIVNFILQYYPEFYSMNDKESKEQVFKSCIVHVAQNTSIKSSDQNSFILRKFVEKHQKQFDILFDKLKLNLNTENIPMCIYTYRKPPPIVKTEIVDNKIVLIDLRNIIKFMYGKHDYDHFFDNNKNSNEINDLVKNLTKTSECFNYNILLIKSLIDTRQNIFSEIFESTTYNLEYCSSVNYIYVAENSTIINVILENWLFIEDIQFNVLCDKINEKLGSNFFEISYVKDFCQYYHNEISKYMHKKCNYQTIFFLKIRDIVKIIIHHCKTFEEVQLQDSNSSLIKQICKEIRLDSTLENFNIISMLWKYNSKNICDLVKKECARDFNINYYLTAIINSVLHYDEIKINTKQDILVQQICNYMNMENNDSNIKDIINFWKNNNQVKDKIKRWFLLDDKQNIFHNIRLMNALSTCHDVLDDARDAIFKYGSAFLKKNFTAFMKYWRQNSVVMNILFEDCKIPHFFITNMANVIACLVDSYDDIDLKENPDLVERICEKMNLEDFEKFKILTIWNDNIQNIQQLVDERVKIQIDQKLLVETVEKLYVNLNIVNDVETTLNLCWELNIPFSHVVNYKISEILKNNEKKKNDISIIKIDSNVDVKRSKKFLIKKKTNVEGSKQTADKSNLDNNNLSKLVSKKPSFEDSLQNSVVTLNKISNICCSDIKMAVSKCYYIENEFNFNSILYKVCKILRISCKSKGNRAHLRKIWNNNVQNIQGVIKQIPELRLKLHDIVLFLTQNYKSVQEIKDGENNIFSKLTKTFSSVKFLKQMWNLNFLYIQNIVSEYYNVCNYEESVIDYHFHVIRKLDIRHIALFIICHVNSCSVKKSLNILELSELYATFIFKITSENPLQMNTVRGLRKVLKISINHVQKMIADLKNGIRLKKEVYFNSDPLIVTFIAKILPKYMIKYEERLNENVVHATLTELGESLTPQNTIKILRHWNSNENLRQYVAKEIIKYNKRRPLNPNTIIDTVIEYNVIKQIDLRNVAVFIRNNYSEIIKQDPNFVFSKCVEHFVNISKNHKMFRKNIFIFSDIWEKSKNFKILYESEKMINCFNYFFEYVYYNHDKLFISKYGNALVKFVDRFEEINMTSQELISKMVMELEVEHLRSTMDIESTIMKHWLLNIDNIQEIVKYLLVEKNYKQLFSQLLEYADSHTISSNDVINFIELQLKNETDNFDDSAFDECLKHFFFTSNSNDDLNDIKHILKTFWRIHKKLKTYVSSNKKLLPDNFNCLTLNNSENIVPEFFNNEESSSNITDINSSLDENKNNPSINIEKKSVDDLLINSSNDSCKNNYNSPSNALIHDCSSSIDKSLDGKNQIEQSIEISGFVSIDNSESVEENSIKKNEKLSKISENEMYVENKSVDECKRILRSSTRTSANNTIDKEIKNSKHVKRIQSKNSMEENMITATSSFITSTPKKTFENIKTDYKESNTDQYVSNINNSTNTVNKACLKIDSKNILKNEIKGNKHPVNKHSSFKMLTQDEYINESLKLNNKNDTTPKKISSQVISDNNNLENSQKLTSQNKTVKDIDQFDNNEKIQSSISCDLNKQDEAANNIILKKKLIKNDKNVSESNNSDIKPKIEKDYDFCNLKKFHRNLDKKETIKFVDFKNAQQTDNLQQTTNEVDNNTNSNKLFNLEILNYSSNSQDDTVEHSENYSFQKREVKNNSLEQILIPDKDLETRNEKNDNSKIIEKSLTEFELDIPKIVELIVKYSSGFEVNIVDMSEDICKDLFLYTSNKNKNFIINLWKNNVEQLKDLTNEKLLMRSKLNELIDLIVNHFESFEAINLNENNFLKSISEKLKLNENLIENCWRFNNFYIQNIVKEIYNKSEYEQTLLDYNFQTIKQIDLRIIAIFISLNNPTFDMSNIDVISDKFCHNIFNIYDQQSLLYNTERHVSKIISSNKNDIKIMLDDLKNGIKLTKKLYKNEDFTDLSLIAKTLAKYMVKPENRLDSKIIRAACNELVGFNVNFSKYKLIKQYWLSNKHFREVVNDYIEDYNKNRPSEPHELLETIVEFSNIKQIDMRNVARYVRNNFRDTLKHQPDLVSTKCVEHFVGINLEHVSFSKNFQIFNNMLTNNNFITIYESEELNNCFNYYFEYLYVDCDPLFIGNYVNAITKFVNNFDEIDINSSNFLNKVITELGLNLCMPKFKEKIISKWLNNEDNVQEVVQTIFDEKLISSKAETIIEYDIIRKIDLRDIASFINENFPYQIFNNPTHVFTECVKNFINIDEKNILFQRNVMFFKNLWINNENLRRIYDCISNNDKISVADCHFIDENPYFITKLVNAFVKYVDNISSSDINSVEFLTNICKDIEIIPTESAMETIKSHWIKNIDNVREIIKKQLNEKISVEKFEKTIIEHNVIKQIDLRHIAQFVRFKYANDIVRKSIDVFSQCVNYFFKTDTNDAIHYENNVKFFSDLWNSNEQLKSLYYNYFISTKLKQKFIKNYIYVNDSPFFVTKYIKAFVKNVDRFDQIDLKSSSFLNNICVTLGINCVCDSYSKIISIWKNNENREIDLIKQLLENKAYSKSFKETVLEHNVIRQIDLRSIAHFIKENYQSEISYNVDYVLEQCVQNFNKIVPKHPLYKKSLDLFKNMWKNSNLKVILDNFINNRYKETVDDVLYVDKNPYFISDYVNAIIKNAENFDEINITSEFFLNSISKELGLNPENEVRDKIRQIWNDNIDQAREVVKTLFENKFDETSFERIIIDFNVIKQIDLRNVAQFIRFKLAKHVKVDLKFTFEECAKHFMDIDLSNVLLKKSINFFNNLWDNNENLKLIYQNFELNEKHKITSNLYIDNNPFFISKYVSAFTDNFDDFKAINIYCESTIKKICDHLEIEPTESAKQEIIRIWLDNEYFERYIIKEMLIIKSYVKTFQKTIIKENVIKEIDLRSIAHFVKINYKYEIDNNSEFVFERCVEYFTNLKSDHAMFETNLKLFRHLWNTNNILKKLYSNYVNHVYKLWVKNTVYLNNPRFAVKLINSVIKIEDNLNEINDKTENFLIKLSAELQLFMNSEMFQYYLSLLDNNIDNVCDNIRILFENRIDEKSFVDTIVEYDLIKQIDLRNLAQFIRYNYSEDIEINPDNVFEKCVEHFIRIDKTNSMFERNFNFFKNLWLTNEQLKIIYENFSSKTKEDNVNYIYVNSGPLFLTEYVNSVIKCIDSIDEINFNSTNFLNTLCNELKLPETESSFNKLKYIWLNNVDNVRELLKINFFNKKDFYETVIEYNVLKQIDLRKIARFIKENYADKITDNSNDVFIACVEHFVNVKSGDVTFTNNFATFKELWCDNKDLHFIYNYYLGQTENCFVTTCLYVDNNPCFVTKYINAIIKHVKSFNDIDMSSEEQLTKLCLELKIEPNSTSVTNIVDIWVNNVNNVQNIVKDLLINSTVDVFNKDNFDKIVAENNIVVQFDLQYIVKFFLDKDIVMENVSNELFEECIQNLNLNVTVHDLQQWWNNNSENVKSLFAALKNKTKYQHLNIVYVNKNCNKTLIENIITHQIDMKDVATFLGTIVTFNDIEKFVNEKDISQESPFAMCAKKFFLTKTSNQLLYASTFQFVYHFDICGLRSIHKSICGNDELPQINSIFQFDEYEIILKLFQSLKIRATSFESISSALLTEICNDLKLNDNINKFENSTIINYWHENRYNIRNIMKQFFLNPFRDCIDKDIPEYKTVVENKKLVQIDMRNVAKFMYTLVKKSSEIDAIQLKDNDNIFDLCTRHFIKDVTDVDMKPFSEFFYQSWKSNNNSLRSLYEYLETSVPIKIINPIFKKYFTSFEVLEALKKLVKSKSEISFKTYPKNSLADKICTEIRIKNTVCNRLRVAHMWIHNTNSIQSVLDEFLSQGENSEICQTKHLPVINLENQISLNSTFETTTNKKLVKRKIISTDEPEAIVPSAKSRKVSFENKSENVPKKKSAKKRFSEMSNNNEGSSKKLKKSITNNNIESIETKINLQRDKTKIITNNCNLKDMENFEDFMVSTQASTPSEIDQQEISDISNTSAIISKHSIINSTNSDNINLQKDSSSSNNNDILPNNLRLMTNDDQDHSWQTIKDLQKKSVVYNGDDIKEISLKQNILDNLYLIINHQNEIQRLHYKEVVQFLYKRTKTMEICWSTNNNDIANILLAAYSKPPLNDQNRNNILKWWQENLFVIKSYYEALSENDYSSTDEYLSAIHSQLKNVDKIADIIIKYVLDFSKISFKSIKDETSLLKKVCKDLNMECSHVIHCQLRQMWSKNYENIREITKKKLSEKRKSIFINHIKKSPKIEFNSKNQDSQLLKKKIHEGSQSNDCHQSESEINKSGFQKSFICNRRIVQIDMRRLATFLHLGKRSSAILDKLFIYDEDENAAMKLGREFSQFMGKGILQEEYAVKFLRTSWKNNTNKLRSIFLAIENGYDVPTDGTVYRESESDNHYLTDQPKTSTHNLEIKIDKNQLSAEKDATSKPETLVHSKFPTPREIRKKNSEQSTLSHVARERVNKNSCVMSDKNNSIEKKSKKVFKIVKEDLGSIKTKTKSSRNKMRNVKSNDESEIIDNILPKNSINLTKNENKLSKSVGNESLNGNLQLSNSVDYKEDDLSEIANNEISKVLNILNSKLTQSDDNKKIEQQFEEKCLTKLSKSPINLNQFDIKMATSICTNVNENSTISENVENDNWKNTFTDLPSSNRSNRYSDQPSANTEKCINKIKPKIVVVINGKHEEDYTPSLTTNSTIKINRRIKKSNQTADKLVNKMKGATPQILTQTKNCNNLFNDDSFNVVNECTIDNIHEDLIMQAEDVTKISTSDLLERNVAANIDNIIAGENKNINIANDVVSDLFMNSEICTSPITTSTSEIISINETSKNDDSYLVEAINSNKDCFVGICEEFVPEEIVISKEENNFNKL